MIKRIITIVFYLVFTSTIVLAQSEKTLKKLQKMTELVKLTAQQQEQYKALLIKFEVEKNEMKIRLAKLSKDEQKRARKIYKDKYEAELKKVLTVAQMKLLKKQKAENDNN